MKKTIIINISNYIFHIDEDAYEKLRNWLDVLKKQFESEQGGDEIINDIEARVVELFKERLTSQKEAIVEADVEEIIKIMGTVEDISEEEVEEPKTNRKKFFSDNSKRLFRNPENRVLGGICGGLGSYLNIPPIIIRIIFIISILFYGSGIWIYILVWFLLPEAKTAANKLEMKGERVNISNIEKTIKHEFKAVKSNFNKWTHSDGYNKFRNGFIKFWKQFVEVLRALFKAFYKLLGLDLMFIGIITLLTFTTTFLWGGTIAEYFLPEAVNLQLSAFLNLFPIPFSSYIAIISVYVLVAIPLFAITFIGSKILFNYKSKNGVIILVGLVIWIGAIISTALFGLKTAINYKTETSHTDVFTLDNTKTDTLYLSVNDFNNSDYENSYLRIDDVRVSFNDDNFQIYGTPVLTVKKSTNNDIEIKVKYFANGRNMNDATEYAKEINYNWTQKDSLIEFDKYFSITENKKFQLQYVQITVYLPVGKSIFISHDMLKIIYDIHNQQNMWDHNMTEKTWTMTNNGLDLSNLIVKNQEMITKDTTYIQLDTIEIQ